MECPTSKEVLKDCPRFPFGTSKSKRRKFFNVDSYWICNFPFTGKTNILEIRDKIEKPPKPDFGQPRCSAFIET
jgi:hypothetical protein